MPAEWEPHARCWMQWPHREGFVFDDLTATQTAYARTALTIREFEPVTLIVHPDGLTKARELCGAKIDYLALPIDDAWARDSGPNFVVHDRTLAASVFGFNAWGMKYAHLRHDMAVGHRVAEHLTIRTFTADIFMEGGGVNVDGQGTVLTSESCILHPNRNPGITHSQAERALCDALGATKVVWVPGDPDDEETDGHVDGVACFSQPGQVLCSSASADFEERRRIGRANKAALLKQCDALGNPFTVVDLPEANDAHGQGDRFCRSYVNFYIANGGVVLPSYGIPADALAAGIVGEAFPGRRVVAVAVHAIAVGGGGLHCITQQQPQI